MPKHPIRAAGKDVVLIAGSPAAKQGQAGDRRDGVVERLAHISPLVCVVAGAPAITCSCKHDTAEAASHPVIVLLPIDHNTQH